MLDVRLERKGNEVRDDIDLQIAGWEALTVVVALPVRYFGTIAATKAPSRSASCDWLANLGGLGDPLPSLVNHVSWFAASFDSEPRLDSGLKRPPASPSRHIKLICEA